MDREQMQAAIANLHFLSHLQEDKPNSPIVWDPVFDTLAEEEQLENTPLRTTGPTDLRIHNLLRAFRSYGYHLANINPVEAPESELDCLKLDTLGFSKEELLLSFPTCGFLKKKEAPLQEIIDALKDTYCNKIGMEYMYLQHPLLEKWLQEKVEPNHFKCELSIDEKRRILQQLNHSELFEVFLQTKFVGQKRFSIEGAETLLPILNALVEKGAKEGVVNFLIGMSHRGRLNVLANILHKSYSEIFSEFEENYVPNSFQGAGDVKYHQGFKSDITTSTGAKVAVTLAANPSHLESVNAIVLGKARATQILNGDDIEMKKVIPVIIHGDAAVSGQGIVYECLQFYNLPGYGVGGSIHIVINNQIGFTTLPKDSRSTKFCTDIAQVFSAPVFHVNAEDLEGCVYATNLAIEIRQHFGCDVFIDLNCYRKYGHNESDEPAFTQPLEYELIKKKKSIRQIYRDHLIHQGVVEKKIAEALESEFRDSLQDALQGRQQFKAVAHQRLTSDPKDEKKNLLKLERSILKSVNTKVSASRLRELAKIFCSIPEGFSVHPKLSRLIGQRLNMMEAAPEAAVVDWGMAEHLAFASILDEGTHVRLSGQDSRRGTFSHRHALWVDQNNAKKYFPLSQIKPKQGRFDIFNSPLSEYAVLGFEFGYSLIHTKALIIWEAQFGDFSNGAQIIIDEYIATAEQKWNRKSSLALFLPHGYEGQGPDHSSARMERFLQLAGDFNMFIVHPTTPAQLFHLLRRQAYHPIRKPLIVFTPKGLLRHPECVSSMNALSEETFEEVLDDPHPPTKKPKRLLLCNGRIFYDLLAERRLLNNTDCVILRVEQLFPLNRAKLKALIESYKGFKQVYWVQEEPTNMGAWDFIRPHLREILDHKMEPYYVGRGHSASPATGSHALHDRESELLLKEAFAEKPRGKYQQVFDQGVKV